MRGLIKKRIRRMCVRSGVLLCLLGLCFFLIGAYLANFIVIDIGLVLPFLGVAMGLFGSIGNRNRRRDDFPIAIRVCIIIVLILSMLLMTFLSISVLFDKTLIHSVHFYISLCISIEGAALGFVLFYRSRSGYYLSNAESFLDDSISCSLALFSCILIIYLSNISSDSTISDIIDDILYSTLLIGGIETLFLMVVKPCLRILKKEYIGE